VKARGDAHGERGQGTVEWLALILLVSIVALTLGAMLGVGLPGAALARAVAARIVCAAGLEGSCDGQTERLVAAYGDELAGLIRDHAPAILYEGGMRALPVDYRRCREDACAEGAEAGEVWRSATGEPVVAFVHAIDCRPGASPPLGGRGADCSGARSGNVYLQYWLYYPGSATAEGSIAPGVVRTVSSAIGKPSFHRDDWEGYQVRIGPDGRFARASSHQAYGPGWLAEERLYRVSGGSHAGTVLPRDFARATPSDRLRLIPLEPIAARHPRTEFAITPPWLKRVWLDPEYEGTD
jgi:hypothetical protein